VVAHLVRLKLTLLRNGLRRSPWQVVGLAVGGLYGLAVLVLAIAGLVTASATRPDLLPAITVLLGSVLVLAWALVPLIAFGVDATVDPARFVLFPIPRRALVTGLAIGALVGVPGLVTTLVALTMAGVWWRDPLALVAGLVGSVVGVLTCIVASRATTTLMSALLARRRFREILAALVVLPFVLIGPLLSQAHRLDLGEDDLDRAVQVLGWTPVGAAWAVPAAVTDGDLLGALARLAVALVTLLVLAVVWDRALARSAVSPPHEQGSSKVRGLGWFGRLPATPLGAVTARCLTYWVRDPRYAMSIVFIPVFPLILWVVAPDSQMLLFVGPITAFFLGWSISQDVSFDGTAFWTHVAAPLRGQTDRLGRVLAVVLLGLPVVLLFSVVPTVATGHADDLATVLGLSAGAFLTSLGVASVASALVVMPVQKVGENPFGSRQGGSTAALTSQLAGWAATFGLTLPTIVLAVVAVRQSSTLLAWLTVLVGLGLGATILVLGVRIGGRALERHQTRLLSRLVTFP
jgi:ABC-2 type transport system permease protein